MIKTLINSLFLTIMTATPGVVGAYFTETNNTNILNEILGAYDYGDANANNATQQNITVNGDYHVELKGYYDIDASKMNTFLPTLKTWYLTNTYLGIDTIENTGTSYFKVEMGESVIKPYSFYSDTMVFTDLDLSMIKDGYPIQLKEWKTNNYEPSEMVLLTITIQYKVIIPTGYTVISVIGNDEFYPFLLSKIAQANYNDGYFDGNHDGYEDGYDDGLVDGYDQGYDIGYNVGLDLNGDGTVNNVFALLEKGWNGMSNMLEIEVFPNITIGGLLMIPLLFTIGLFIFKVLT